jgi:uncharacterized protein (TIGR03435 family)
MHPTSIAVIAFVAAAAAAAPRQDAARGRPAFEAATIKPAAPGTARTLVAPASTNRLYIPNMTLTTLIYAAYGDGGFNTSMRVTGGADWVNRTAFSVEAVAAGQVTPRDIRLMLQTLLEERFALKIRRTTEESETNNVLGLVVDRSDGILGPKVRKWDGTCPSVMPTLYLYASRRPIEQVGDRFVAGPASATHDPAVTYCPTGYRDGGIRVDGATMVTVAELLSLPSARALLGMFTQDRTGLTERYSMDLDYPGLGNGLGGPAAAAEFAGPSLATAVREQWGLRLVPSKGQLKVVIVESAQLPTGN